MGRVKPWHVSACSISISAFFVIVAWLLPAQGFASIMESLLLNMAAATLLLVPIDLGTRALRKQVEGAEERQIAAIESGEKMHQAAVEDVRSQSEQQLQQVRERLTHLEERDRTVAAQHHEDRQADYSVFEAVTESTATGSDLWKALARADRQNLISKRGVHVPYSKSSDFTVQFKRLQAPAHAEVGRVTWMLLDHNKRPVTKNTSYIDPSQKIDQFLGRLRQLAHANGEASDPLVSSVLGGLAETLRVAYDEPDARPIIQYFSPQWAITEQKLTAIGRSGWGIDHQSSNRLRMLDEDAPSKTWVDLECFEEASHVDQILFPLLDEQADHGT